MTQQLNSLGKSALLILSNTIIVLPFMIFIQIAKGTSLLALLPFLLFYTFRMTGVFFRVEFYSNVSALEGPSQLPLILQPHY